MEPPLKKSGEEHGELGGPQRGAGEKHEDKGVARRNGCGFQTITPFPIHLCCLWSGEVEGKELEIKE